MNPIIIKSTRRAISRILVVAIFSSMLVGVVMPINGANASQGAVGSICFDNSSTASYINLNNSNNAVGTGDFTLEMWAKLASGTPVSALVNGHSVNNGANTLSIFTDGNPGQGNSSINTIGSITKPGSIPANTWVHVAYVRTGGLGVWYVNGVPKTYNNADLTSVTDNNNYTSTNFRVGYPLTTAWPAGFTGCLAGVALTKRALYSANFSANLPYPSTRVMPANSVIFLKPTAEGLSNTGTGAVPVTTGSVSVNSDLPSASGSSTIAISSASISGSMNVNQVLTAVRGTVSNSASYITTYQWRRAGVAIPGAISSTYTLTSDDIGSGISVTITVQDESVSAFATSASTVMAKLTPTFNAWSGVSKNFGDSAFSITAPTEANSLAGSFTYSSATTSVISVSGTTLTVAGVGNSIITATFTPTDSTRYNSATTTMTVSVGKATPTFSSWSNVSKNYGDSAFTVTAPSVTGSVAGSFSYSSGTTSVISVSGTSLTVVGAGSSVITATFTPNDTTIYNSATTTMTVSVGAASQTITRTSTSPTSPVKSGTYTPTATASSGLTVAISIATGSSSICSISAGVVTFNTAGSCVIQYNQIGNSNYSAATQVNETLTIGKATPTFSAWSGVSKNYGDSAFTVTAPTVTGSLGGTFTYSSATTSVISVSGATLTVVGAGTSDITATFTPTDSTNYNSATTTMTVTVGKAVLSITSSSHTVAYGAAIPEITPTYSGFVNGDTSSVVTAPICSTTYTTTTAVGSVASSCIGATASNYSFAYTAGVITITQAGQISVLAITSTTVIYGSTLSLITSGGDGGGSNSFLVDSGPCTVSGSTLTPTAVGTCMVTATKAASSNYLATNSSSTAITVTPKGLTVSGLTGVNKEFDRSLTGTVTGTPTLVGVVGLDDVLLLGTPAFTFASANAGNGISLAASGYTLTGTTAGNYTLTQPTMTANITAKAVRVLATNTTVAFGASVTSGVTVTGLISPDAIGSASYTYTGTGTSTPPTAVGIYTVTPSNAVFSTGLIGNYAISYDTATVTILAKYTITYNANGGVIGSSSTTSADFLVGDNALALPTATREGFNFLGWFTLQSSGVQVTGAYTPSATAILWAHWIQKSLVGVGNSQKIGTITTLANVGNTYSATSTSGTVAVTYAANALPVGTVIDIYQMADSSRASSMISSTNNYVLSLVVAWLTPASTVPLLSVNDALTMVITDSAIKKGAKVYSLIGSESTLLGTATADGSVTVRILEDPEVYIAITKPDAPTGVSATSGGDASSTVSWIAPSDGGSAITLYTATSNAGQTCSSATTSCAVTGLTNGTPYTFTVTATNSIGTSDPSAPSSAITPAAPAAPVVVTPPAVTAPSSGGGGGGGGGGGSTYVAPTPTVDPEVAAAAAAAAKALAEKAATEAKLAAEAKAVADAKAAADKKAAEEAELLATLKTLQEKADAEALAAAKKVADELAAAQLKAEEELKASDALKLAEEQRIAAERAAAAKRITTVYSTSAAFKLNTTYTKRLKTNTKKIAAGSTVTCIGYAKSSKTLTYAKAKVVATKQAKALCSSMKKIKPTLKTKSIVLPASKAPKATVSKRWIPVSYRVETTIN